MTQRIPTVAQVHNAARILATALVVEANRIRDEEPNGHIAAEKLEYEALRIGDHAARIEAMRVNHR